MTALVRAKARALHRNREDGRQMETDLIRAIDEAVAEHGKAKELADGLGVSQAFLSDVRAGNRGISDSLLGKLMVAR